MTSRRFKLSRFSREVGRLGLALPILLLAGGLLAQTPALPTRQEQRDRIAQQRASAEADFAAAQRQCYQHFAVNDCLLQARRARRQAFDELRRQELLLNREQRQELAVQALERIHRNVQAAGAEPARALPAAAGSP